MSGEPISRTGLITASSHSRSPRCPSKLQISASVEKLRKVNLADVDLSKEHIDGRSEQLLTLVEQAVRQCCRIRMIEPSPSVRGHRRSADASRLAEIAEDAYFNEEEEPAPSLPKSIPGSDELVDYEEYD